MMRIEAAVHMAMWDAWAPYHPTAAPMGFAMPAGRREALEPFRTNSHEKEIAISVAVHYVAKHLLPKDKMIFEDGLGMIETETNLHKVTFGWCDDQSVAAPTYCRGGDAWPDVDLLAAEWRSWESSTGSNLYEGSPQTNAWALGAYVGHKLFCCCEHACLPCCIRSRALAARNLPLPALVAT